MNERKKKNSAILLADGLEIGHQGGSVSYQELTGVLGNLLSVIRSHRTGWLESSPGNKHLPIPGVCRDVIACAMEGKITKNLSASAAVRDKMPRRTNLLGTNGTEDAIVVDDDDKEEETEF